jgi:hypothetical protein
MARSLVLAAALALAAASSALAASFVIQGDYRIGGYAVKADGSLAGAIDQFGQPTSIRRDARFREFCYVRWAGLGMRMTLYNLGGVNPCRPSAGRFSDALITGRRWRTANGLAMRDSLARLRRLYPRATRHGAWWWLVTRRSPFGERLLYPGLAAKVRRGRVVAFAVSYAAGGD